MSDGRVRRGYLDLLRGVAVLIMIEAHVIDTWTRFPDRQTRGRQSDHRRWIRRSSLSLSRGRRGRAVGWIEIPALWRCRSGVRRRRSPRARDLRPRVPVPVSGVGARLVVAALAAAVDILNIMGPSIMAAAAMWGAVRTTAGRFAAFTAATLAVTLTTPIVRNISVLSALPDPIEAYIRPVRRAHQLRLFPVGGICLCRRASSGSCSTRCGRPSRSGSPISASPSLASECAYGAYELSFLPSPYPHSQFWTTSPTFFFIRVGIMVAAIAVAYLWELRPGGTTKWSPMQQLGPHIALHLLDSRRDGVRPRFAAAAQASFLDAVVDRARDLLPAHARMFDLERPVGRIKKKETGTGVRRQKTGVRS